MWSSKPLVATLQRRFVHSEDQAPYERAENVGGKPFSQFDAGGKVFVVTGAACRTTLYRQRRLAAIDQV